MIGSFYTNHRANIDDTFIENKVMKLLQLDVYVLESFLRDTS